MMISAIDPGYSSCGMVWIRSGDHRVFDAFSPKPSSGERQAAEDFAKEYEGDRQFTVASILMQTHVQRIVDLFDRREEMAPAKLKTDLVVVESFVDQPSQAKKMLRDRWKPPLAIGLLVAELARRGFTVEAGNLIFQNASVLGQFRVEMDLIKDRDPATLSDDYPGSNQLTNEHMRSAFVHGLYRALRVDEEI